MNAVLEQARELGITIQTDGVDLIYRPKTAAPPEFVETMRANKASLIEYLSRYRRKYAGDGPPGEAELAEIEATVLDKGYVLLWSTVLEDFVAFYRDEEARQHIPPGFVPYSDEELRHLSWADPSDNGLRLIHEAKKHGGQITGTEHLEEENGA